MRLSKTRNQMRRILNGHPGRLVILDLRDDLGFLNQQEREGDYTVGQWVETCRSLGIDANVIVGEDDYLPAEHDLGWKKQILREDAGLRILEKRILSPQGPLTIELQDRKGEKPSRTRMALHTEADYAKAMCYWQALRQCRSEVVTHFCRLRQEVGDQGLLTVFVSQPLEMHYLILQGGMVAHYLDFPETYAAAMEEVEETSRFIIECAAEAGADVIMFGGAGTEIFNPRMIEQHIVAPARRYVELCHARQIFSLMHCCGRTRVYLEKGWIANVHPTIFESFTSTPLGDIADPAQAVAALPPDIFFKGGLDLEGLLHGDADTAAAMTRKACENFGSRPFILAGTCAILTGTRREVLQAVSETAANFEVETQTLEN